MNKELGVFERLDVWRLSHQLALEIYRLTKGFPQEENYGLTPQLRRAALAIPTNIAEGNARGSPADYLRFCLIARGSLAEVRYLLHFALDLGVLGPDRYAALSAEYARVGKMLYFLISSLRRGSSSKWVSRSRTPALPRSR